jgi:PAS domain S-box-containing protein
MIPVKTPLKDLENRLNKIENTLVSYSQGDFSKKLNISDDFDTLDIIMSGVNMLGEELKEITIGKNFFNSAFNSVTDSLVVINHHGEIVDYNNSFISMLYFEVVDLKWQKVTQFVKLHDFEKIIKKVEKDLSVHTLNTEVFSNNNNIAVECSISPIDPQKRLFLIKIQDLTDKLQEEARRIATIIKTQEDERNRVASDLHDSVGQQISALKFFINSLQNQKDEKLKDDLFKKTQKIIDGVADEIRNICFQLMPRSIERFGLLKTVEQLADLVQFSTQINFTLKLEPITQFIEPNTAMSVYRIIQEFVNNSTKHSGCKNIFIDLKADQSNLLLKMADDGVGFDYNTINKGNGIDNMNLRVNYLNGDINIKSQKDEGVSIEIMIPLK